MLLRRGELLAQFAGQLQQLLAQRCGAGPGAEAALLLLPAPAADATQLQQLCQQLTREVQLLLQVRVCVGVSVVRGSQGAFQRASQDIPPHRGSHPT